MRTLAETGATRPGLPAASLVAAAVAAGASLLNWVGTTTDTHSWSSDAVISLLGGAGLMALAIALAGRPWSLRTLRTLCLVGAVGTAVALMAYLLPVLSELTSGHAEQGEHAGHTLAGSDALITAEVVRTAMEVILIGLLAWMHRVTAPDTFRRTVASD